MRSDRFTAALSAALVALACASCGGPSTHDRAVESCGGKKKIAQLGENSFTCKRTRPNPNLDRYGG